MATIESIRADFAKLIRDRHARTQEICEQFIAGEITAEEWYELMASALLDGHVKGYTLGRQLAGDSRDAMPMDYLKGSAARDLETDFLIAYLDDLNDPSSNMYDAEGNLKVGWFKQRSSMYVAKVGETGNNAFVDHSPSDDSFKWALGVAEHCEDCIAMAELSPYTRATLWTVPKGGDTECLTNCHCRIERSSDQRRSFAHVKLVIAA